jgi:hypothetical protein
MRNITERTVIALLVQTIVLFLNLNVMADMPGLVPSPSEIATRVQESYKKYRSINYLTIDFSMKYEHVAGKRQFAFDSLRVITKRQAPKMRLQIKAFIDKKPSIDRDYAWDGKRSSSIQMFMNESLGDYTLSKAKDSNMLYYNYYVDFLNYPDASGSVPVIATGNAIKSMRWLPDSFISENSKYAIRRSKDSSELSDCIILDYPGHEAFWFDPKIGYAMRRHDIFDLATSKLKYRTTLSEFQDVGGVWLPVHVIREEFGQPERPDAIESELFCRKTITVNQFSTESLPDSDFVLAAPEGIKANDLKKIVFIRNSKAEIIRLSSRLKLQVPLSSHSEFHGSSSLPLSFLQYFSFCLPERLAFHLQVKNEHSLSLL